MKKRAIQEKEQAMQEQHALVREYACELIAACSQWVDVGMGFDRRRMMHLSRRLRTEVLKLSRMP